MFFLKIIALIAGIFLTGFGTYLFSDKSKGMKISGPLLALIGLTLFVLSTLLIFVPGFLK